MCKNIGSFMNLLGRIFGLIRAETRWRLFRFASWRASWSALKTKKTLHEDQNPIAAELSRLRYENQRLRKARAQAAPAPGDQPTPRAGTPATEPPGISPARLREIKEAYEQKIVQQKQDAQRDKLEALDKMKKEYERERDTLKAAFTAEKTEIKERLDLEIKSLASRKMTELEAAVPRPLRGQLPRPAIAPAASQGPAKEQVEEELRAFREKRLHEIEADLGVKVKKALETLQKLMDTKKSDILQNREKELVSEMEALREKRLAAMNEEIMTERAKIQRQIEEWVVAQGKQMSFMDASGLNTTLEAEVKKERNRRYAQMEKDLEQDRQRAVKEIFSWVETERERLGSLFEKEQEASLLETMKEMEKRVVEEFEQVHSYFADFVTEKKSVADRELKEFLNKRLAGILKKTG